MGKKVSWGTLIPESQWESFLLATCAARRDNIPFLFGGAFGMGAYTDRLRNTKDVDFFILPKNRDAMVRCLAQCGFVDYYDELPYDRTWIYRGIRNGAIVDIIWTLPNHRTIVDSLWFDRATPLEIRGEILYAVPAEELVWIKLYVMQKDRSDWPDVINIFRHHGAVMDWDHLIWRVGSDLELLRAALVLYNWVAPAAARTLPDIIRKQFHLPNLDQIAPVGEGDAIEREHVRLLDSRNWYAAFVGDQQLMNL